VQAYTIWSFMQFLTLYLEDRWVTLPPARPPARHECSSTPFRPPARHECSSTLFRAVPPPTARGDRIALWAARARRLPHLMLRRHCGGTHASAQRMAPGRQRMAPGRQRMAPGRQRGAACSAMEKEREAGGPKVDVVVDASAEAEEGLAVCSSTPLSTPSSIP
jgi:hypothetical protein